MDNRIFLCEWKTPLMQPLPLFVGFSLVFIVWSGIGRGGGCVVALTLVPQQEERQGNLVGASLYYEQAAEVTSASSPQAEESGERE